MEQNIYNEIGPYLDSLKELGFENDFCYFSLSYLKIRNEFDFEKFLDFLLNNQNELVKRFKQHSEEKKRMEQALYQQKKKYNISPQRQKPDTQNVMNKHKNQQQQHYENDKNSKQQNYEEEEEEKKSQQDCKVVTKKEYKFGNFDYKVDINSEFIQNNGTIQNIFKQWNYIEMELKKKLNRKDNQITKITDYHHFTQIEYLVWRAIDLEKKKQEKVKHTQEEECSICMCELYDIDVDIETHIKQLKNDDENQDVILLKNCHGHFFHQACFKSYLTNNKMTDYTKCPVCQQIFGVMKGGQPHGTMSVQRRKDIKLSGYDYGTIIITYNFQGGKSPDINNGVGYSGTSRTAYLPDNKQGREILTLLEIAFQRKLIFTVGTSVTSGKKNTVVWAGIHHKTSTSPGAFGYPDPSYLGRVREELAARGVK